VSGIALSNRHVFAVTANTAGRASRDPAGPSGLLVFDRRDLTLLAEHVFSSVFDAHSVLALDGELLVVSTGTDEITRVRLDGPNVVSEEVLWRMDVHGPRADVHHLNAICSRRGEVLVSGFGKKTGHLWSTATAGFIVSVTTGERLAMGIGHPHSLIDVEETLAYCESSTATVRLLGKNRAQQLPGYARGLCRVGDRLLVGTSRGRQTSKSTGLTTRADPGMPVGCCAVVTLRLPSLDIERVVDLDELAFELYDLQPVSDVAQWPVTEEAEWRKNLVTGLRAGYEERDATVSWLHAEVSVRDAEIARLHREVAERDRVITWLHGEAAERDHTITWLHGEAAERDRTITWLHGEVAERDRTITWLHGEVAERDPIITWLHREVANRDRLIDGLRQSQSRSPGQVESDP
jgi:hypothetical protein